MGQIGRRGLSGLRRREHRRATVACIICLPARDSPQAISCFRNFRGRSADGGRCFVNICRQKTSGGQSSARSTRYETELLIFAEDIPTTSIESGSYCGILIKGSGGSAPLYNDDHPIIPERKDAV